LSGGAFYCHQIFRQGRYEDVVQVVGSVVSEVQTLSFGKKCYYWPLDNGGDISSKVITVAGQGGCCG